MGQWGKKRKTIHHYDQTAASYDVQYAEEQHRKMEAALRVRSLKEGGSILDLGCGTGLLFSHIANKGRFIVGIDVSANLLKEAHKRARQHNNIALIRADADHTPFREQIFHHVFAITLLQNMPNPKVMLKEIERIVKPCAITVLTVLKKSFTQKAITVLLRKTRLRTIAVETTPETKDHLIVCEAQFLRH
jgi:ubiquinone/menaquinone biosynthesis C-methylase UbiE